MLFQLAGLALAVHLALPFLRARHVLAVVGLKLLLVLLGLRVGGFQLLVNIGVRFGNFGVIVALNFLAARGKGGLGKACPFQQVQVGQHFLLGPVKPGVQRSLQGGAALYGFVKLFLRLFQLVEKVLQIQIFK